MVRNIKLALILLILATSILNVTFKYDSQNFLMPLKLVPSFCKNCFLTAKQIKQNVISDKPYNWESKFENRQALLLFI